MKNMKRIGWVGHINGRLRDIIRPSKRLDLWLGYYKPIPVYIDPKDLRAKKPGHKEKAP